MRLRAVVLCAGVLVMGAGISLHAQTVQQQPQVQPKTTLMMPQGPLLPEKFGAWHGTVTENPDVAHSSFDGAQTFVEDGAKRYATAKYDGSGGSVQVDAIQFIDASGAYSAFTWWAAKQGKSTIAKTDGEQASLREGLIFRSGAVLVLVHDSAAAKQIQTQLTPALPKVNGPRGGLPLVPSLLPSRGLNVGTLRYALGASGFAAAGTPVPAETVGFNKDAEIAVGQYTVRGAKSTLAVFLYPTPQIAGEQGRAIEKAINAERSRYGSAVKLRRDGVLVAMAWGELTPVAADALIKSANLHQELSWNDAMAQMPQFNNEIHKTASLLENIVALSAVLGLGAILLGIFLGFGRAGFRVLMGKPAATEQEFLGINLRAIPQGVLEHPHAPDEGQEPPKSPPSA